MERIKADCNDKYIVCSKCKMKFINDDEHIKNDFGYNRLNIRYRNCVKCRKYNTEKTKSRRAEIQEDFETQIEIYGNYVPNRNKINLTQMK